MSRVAAVVLGVCCAWSVAVAFAEEKKFTPVDLKGHFNYKLGDPNNNEIQGNDMPLMAGEQVLDGVKMEIGDRVIHLGSKHVTQMPE